MENPDQVQVIESKDIWKRGLLMLLFAIAFSIGQMVLNALTIVQFLWLLFAREPNQRLARFGLSLSKWFGETVQFLSCVTDEKPFPWRDWP
ncbi:MAG: DUF4389 domain-containing protein [Rhodomicrobium sp.]|nr:DUF4389 domain-containing protein [Rhodomicrobium sp.]